MRVGFLDMRAHDYADANTKHVGEIVSVSHLRFTKAVGDYNHSSKIMIYLKTKDKSTCEILYNIKDT